MENNINPMGCVGNLGAVGIDRMSRNGIDLSFIKEIKFDLNNRFLIECIKTLTPYAKVKSPTGEITGLKSDTSSDLPSIDFKNVLELLDGIPEKSLAVLVWLVKDDIRVYSGIVL